MTCKEGRKKPGFTWRARDLILLAFPTTLKTPPPITQSLPPITYTGRNIQAYNLPLLSRILWHAICGSSIRPRCSAATARPRAAIARTTASYSRLLVLKPPSLHAKSSCYHWSLRSCRASGGHAQQVSGWVGAHSVWDCGLENVFSRGKARCVWQATERTRLRSGQTCIAGWLGGLFQYDRSGHKRCPAIFPAHPTPLPTCTLVGASGPPARASGPDHWLQIFLRK